MCSFYSMPINSGVLQSNKPSLYVSLRHNHHITQITSDHQHLPLRALASRQTPTSTCCTATIKSTTIPLAFVLTQKARSSCAAEHITLRADCPPPNLFFYRDTNNPAIWWGQKPPPPTPGVCWVNILGSGVQTTHRSSFV